MMKIYKVFFTASAVGDKEVFTMDELIDEFSFERVGKSGARFDPEKSKMD